MDKFPEIYFSIKERETNFPVELEKISEHLNPSLFKKVELNLDRFEAVNVKMISSGWMYRLNACGLKDNFIELIESDESVDYEQKEEKANIGKVGGMKEEKESGKSGFGANKMMVWMSIVLRFFNVYFELI